MKVIVTIKPIQGGPLWTYEVKNSDKSLHVIGYDLSSESKATEGACWVVMSLKLDPVFETNRKLFRLSELIPDDKHQRARISLYEYGLVARNTLAESYTKVSNIIEAFETDFEDEEDMFEYLRVLPPDTLVLMDVC